MIGSIGSIWLAGASGPGSGTVSGSGVGWSVTRFSGNIDPHLTFLDGMLGGYR